MKKKAGQPQQCCQQAELNEYYHTAEEALYKTTLRWHELFTNSRQGEAVLEEVFLLRAVFLFTELGCYKRRNKKQNR